MTDFLQGIKNRERQGILTGIIGMLLNLFLGAGKLVIGLLSGSLSIIADSANSFSDSCSSLVTVISFKVSDKKADRDHPYGHGRFEYIASFLIGTLIVFVGLQFAISSIEKIISPKATEGGAIVISILGVSIAIKFFMYVFYKIRASRINSSALKAASVDSFFDSLTTSVVLVSVLIEQFAGVNVDGIFGFVISIVVLFGGGRVIVSIIGKLLGNGANSELEKEIYNLVLSCELVSGAHDLKVHDYGPNCIIATIDAEFDKNITIVAAHNIIDGAEKAAKEKYGIELVIHVDPVDKSSDEIILIRERLLEALCHYHNSSIHELHIEQDNKLISFHLKLPVKYCELDKKIIEQLKEVIVSIDDINNLKEYEIKIEIDLIYD